MTLILSIIALVSLLESCLWIPAIWKKRIILAKVFAVSVPSIFILLLLIHPSPWTFALLYFALYRSFNMLRVTKARLHEAYLYHASWRTSQVLILAQLSIAALAYVIHVSSVPEYALEYVAACVLLTLSAVVLLTFNRQLVKTKARIQDGVSPSSRLPSVSILIPARNENEDLLACLQSLLTSDYRKLEIIVLDDCSQTSRTSDIIKGFAHDGVRFVPGKAPPEHWLAKNYAYKRLVEEANGEVLLFCGVDTRFETTSVTNLIQEMTGHTKGMLSVAPKNTLSRHNSYTSVCIQAARYAWEFMLPRRFIGRPPVLSTCWLITKAMLLNAGSFEAFKQSVIPERHFARIASRTNDGYRFMQSADVGGVSTVKSYDEQKATAIRTRYPQLRKRPENVALFCILAVLTLVWPFVLVVVAVLRQEIALLLVSGATCVLLGVSGMLLTKLLYRRSLVRGIWILPFTVLTDIATLNYSMYRYEFTEVIWKGRNVCIPVMQVFPRLPRID